MSVGWVAGNVRARAMLRRTLGHRAARQLAASQSLDAAVATLGRSPYGHDLRSGMALGDVQRAVVRTSLWNVRVLSGWAPRSGVTMLRVLLGTLEIANVEDHLRRLAGEQSPAAYGLGGLATAWPRIASCTDPQQVRQVLASSPWGDPGGAGVRDVGLTMRASLADRVIAAVPAARTWAGGATALLLAREVVLSRGPLPSKAASVAGRVVGPLAVAATTLPELVAALPAAARWAVAGVQDPNDLWQAELAWWTKVERDGFALARQATQDSEVLVGAVAVLAVDAWRVRAALELAARGGGPLEAFDAVA